MKRAHFLVLMTVYSWALVAGTSLVWKIMATEPVRGSMCFDSYSCLSPDFMDVNGVMPATVSRNNEVAMQERIREYYVASYRALPEKYEAALACESTVEDKGECKLGLLRSALFNDYVGTAKEQETYEVILASLKKGIDVDPGFSAARKYKGLDGVVAVIASVSAYVPGVGNVGGKVNIFFFRREGASYRLAGVTRTGEDLNTYEAAPVDMFKRGEAEL